MWARAWARGRGREGERRRGRGHAHARARARARARATRARASAPRSLAALTQSLCDALPCCACLRFDGGMKKKNQNLRGAHVRTPCEHARAVSGRGSPLLFVRSEHVRRGMHADGCAVCASEERCASSGRWRSECSEGGSDGLRTRGLHKRVLQRAAHRGCSEDDASRELIFSGTAVVHTHFGYIRLATK